MESKEKTKKQFNMEAFVADCRSKKLKIKVDLLLARKILSSLDGNLTSILGYSFLLLPIIGATMAVLFFGGNYGLFYVVIFTTTLFLYLKICQSTELTKKIILIINIFNVIFSFLFHFKKMLLIAFSCTSFIYAYAYFYYIEWYILNEMAFNDEEVLFTFFKNGIFHFK